VITLRVRKFGSSLGVVLPDEVVSRLSTGDGKQLFLSEMRDGSYRLSPFDPAFEQKMARAADVMRRYRNTLRTLGQ
jgi:antitoxin component of MazEF toxin-antitoxin module